MSLGPGGDSVPTSTVRPAAILVVLALSLGGCGDEDGSETAQTAVSSESPTTPGLSITVEGVAGFESRIVVGILSPSDAVGPRGSVCLPIDRSPWTGTGVFSTFSPDNPCGKEPPYGEVIASDGEYSLVVGVLIPGESTPEACLETTATISGPSAVTVTGTDLVSDCDW
jgi:hypothetical protein